MASKRLRDEEKWTGRRVDFAAFSDALTKRREELGNPELEPNSGENRTDSKKALLKAIKDAGGTW